VVLCCGDLTALGRVAGLAARLQPAPSPLSRELSTFMRYVSFWALGLGFFVARLQPTVTASLTLTAQNMVKKHCLVKNLDAIEALGACTTICSDKTGTLTENKMSVQHIITDLLICGALCSNASAMAGGSIIGDASESAILGFIFKYDNPIAIRTNYPKIAEIPFNSVNKYQVSVHLDTTSSRYFVVMKGAPECIIQRCSTIALDNKNVRSAIERVREAGVRVMMVTGDHPATARAIALDVGIATTAKCHVVSKQTADIILMDDNFATIVTGIEEGRKIFDNLKKSVCYILISNVPEILPVFMFILFSIPLPLGVMTILCVDLGTDMWPAVSLAYEGAESDVMARPPRTSEPLVSTKMIALVYGHLGLIEFAAGMRRWDNEAISDVQDSFGQEWTYAARKEVERASQAAYFVAVVIMQMTNGLICKTRYNSLFHVGMKNKLLNIGLAFEFVLTLALCYVP
ncbi:Sodium/potassium-transporting ATPase subunit alpha, partial [Operophtera brumata]